MRVGGGVGGEGCSWEGEAGERCHVPALECL